MTKKGDYIVLLDPALQDNNGLESKNLGDLIISESILRILEELFPSKQVLRISTHSEIEFKKRRLINDAFLSFVGGTNLITSDIRGYRQFLIRNGRLVWLYPGIKRLILFGCGWGTGYGKKMHFKTKIFYRRILHSNIIHSLRDQYSTDKLHNEAWINSINTSCPSTWYINDTSDNVAALTTTCLFTLTDYNTDPQADDELLKIIIDRFDRIVFFPQGAGDKLYLQTLPYYKKNKEKIEILPYSYSVFKQFLASNSVTYIGTRLHAGIKCLQQQHKSIIIAVDNRAIEMSKDIFLPICCRGNYVTLIEWLNGLDAPERKITIPRSAILEWKNQFVFFS